MVRWRQVLQGGTDQSGLTWYDKRSLIAHPGSNALREVTSFKKVNLRELHPSLFFLRFLTLSTHRTSLS
jgi:hypothetical protein